MKEMSNKKQNSIDWLIDQMIKFELVPKGIHFDNILFHQAKAMHKKEIIDTWYNCKMSVIEKNPTTADQYYEQTFGGQDE